MLPAARLENSLIVLEPLEERHREGLRSAAAEPTIWTYLPHHIHLGFDGNFDRMLALRRDSSWLPFAVSLSDGTIVGQSCYLEYRPVDRSVEIGGTWYRPDAQGSSINPATKLLLLTHAFECGIARVELKTDARNARSRAAIAKLGATMEGVHRKHRLLPDGTWRDSVYFSILDDEWPKVRTALQDRIEA